MRSMRNRRDGVFALVVTAQLCGCGSPPAPERTPPASVASVKGCEGTAPAAVDADSEQQVLELVNAERQQHQLRALRLAPALAEAARLHARDMAEDRYLDHDSFDRSEGRLSRTCAWTERVGRFVSDKNHLAENIAAGASTAREVVDGWMRSPVHRANVLGATFTELGVGYWPGGDSGFYWVADFAGD